MTFKQTPRIGAHDFGHTLGTKKNAREVRAFPDVWILGGAHTAGRESCRNDTNHQRQRATTHRRTRFRRWLLRRTKRAPEARKPARKGRFLGRIGLLHPPPLIGHLFGLLLLPVSWLPIGRRPARTCGGLLSLVAVVGGPTVLTRPLLRFRLTTVARGSWGTLLAGLSGLATTVQKLGLPKPVLGFVRP